MEELLKHPIITLTLSPHFNLAEWTLLTREPSPAYQASMQALSRLLELRMPTLATQYYKFVQNQLTLVRWHQTNAKHRDEIYPYLFDPDHSVSRPLRISQKGKSTSKLSRTEPNAVKKYFAETVGLADSRLNLQIEPVNNYDLYMQTFSACRGKRYAAYDYEKHMRSSQERKRYNEFIRMKHRRHLTNPTHKKEHTLEHFQEWKLNQSQKTSLFNVRKILEDVNLNSERGINRLLKRQGATKLVLLNHQRKPINYYLTSNMSNTRG